MTEAANTTGSAANQFARPDVELVRRDSDVLLRSRVPLADHDATIGSWLRRWAEDAPDRVFLAERPAGDPSQPWIELTYAEALQSARSLGQALLNEGLGPSRPLAVLSGAGIDHGRLMLACHLAGVPIVPVSEAYSLRASTSERVRFILGITEAGAVFAGSSTLYERVLADVADYTIITGDGGTGLELNELAATEATTIDDVADTVGPDTVAKILFTSGSTGNPKGVLTTHSMLTSNQEAMVQVWPFLVDEPPVICDWLPWSHTFGGSHNFNMALRNGGSMYIDAGRPAPELVDVTVANLAAVRPTLAFNVPAGWARLVEQLEERTDLAAAIFDRLRIAFYAGAALSPDVWDRLGALVDQYAPGQVSMVSSWGMTETAPAAVAVHMHLDRAGVIGTPLPGTTVKIVDAGPKSEIRVIGPGVMPGYLNDPERTAVAFDDEGYFITGDAVRLADPDDPNAGLVFDGRIGEDFKLSNGTWVSVGNVRTTAIAAAAPLLLDAVVTGHDRDSLGLIVWLAPGQVDSAELRAGLGDRFAQANLGKGASAVIRRLIIETDLPSIEAGEITDKGYINQAAVLRRRATSVEAMYADEPSPAVVVIPR